jgi:alpha-beta hydrolase superfamily lysophospholipase
MHMAIALELRGLITDYHILTSDCTEFAKTIQEENPGLPTFLLCHSMGTLVVALSVSSIANVKAILFSSFPIFPGPSAASPFGIKALFPLAISSFAETLTSILATVAPMVTKYI